MMRFFESAAEAALVRRAQAGQREAFAALVDRYLPLVHSLALAHAGRIHDAGVTPYPVKTATPLCLSHHPTAALTPEDVLDRAAESRRRLG